MKQEREDVLLKKKKKSCQLCSTTAVTWSKVSLLWDQCSSFFFLGPQLHGVESIIHLSPGMEWRFILVRPPLFVCLLLII